ncbi:MAG: formate dehydrogenase accessory protein FdhE domain-containing protein, partial [Giesbergeria sp.]
MNAQPPTSITRTPEDIVQRSGLETPSLLLPQPSSLFAERALRLRELAASHPMRDYLMLMAVVCEAQHAQAQNPATLVPPTQAQLDAATEAGEPALCAASWPRGESWRTELHALLKQVLEKLPG